MEKYERLELLRRKLCIGSKIHCQIDSTTSFGANLNFENRSIKNMGIGWENSRQGINHVCFLPQSETEEEKKPFGKGGKKYPK